MTREDLSKLSTDALKRWLANHKMCVDAGVNVGQIRKDRAQRYGIEVMRREGVTVR